MYVTFHSMSGLIVDLFAGGGGASTGLTWALGRSPDIAINHAPEALAMHAVNHPKTLHMLNDITRVLPLEATGGRPVDVLHASPDCTHFSKAKGGKPKSQYIRDLAWVVIRWAEDTHPMLITLENVEEFLTWGPLDKNGQPIKAQAGATFRSWVRRLRRLGYRVDWRELRACDYGAPTIRKRLFVVARRDKQPIVWPELTHGDPMYADACPTRAVPSAGISGLIHHRAGVRGEAHQQNGASADVRELCPTTTYCRSCESERPRNLG